MPKPDNNHQRVLLVYIDPLQAQFDVNQQEFVQLAESADATIIELFHIPVKSPTARYLIGTGRTEELKCLVASLSIEIVIFNASLSPSQERNLESAIKCRVIDRTRLILDIFARRAKSFAGKLQVELAQLTYCSTRLVRGWTHLERQKGGIGLRGPGEKQLELDRRMLAKRIKQIKKRLVKIESQRQLSRQSRLRSETLTIALVGYTNAGKSSLFNSLTNQNTYVANQLFATLDPTLRQLKLPHFGKVVLVGTVGFIRDLPPSLIKSFHATLEETIHADLLLHVIDIADKHHLDYIKQVAQVLQDIGVNLHDSNIIEVFNKIDLVDLPVKCQLDQTGKPHQVWLSTKTGNGLDILKNAIKDFITKKSVKGVLTLPPKYGKFRATLYQKKFIINESISEQGAWQMTLEAPLAEIENLCRQFDVGLKQHFVKHQACDSTPIMQSNGESE